MGSRKNASHKQRLTVNDMIICPLCNAMGYPRRLRDPVNKEEEEAVYCPSCNENLTPYIQAYEEYIRVRKEQMLEGKNKEDAEKTAMESEQAILNAAGITGKVIIPKEPIETPAVDSVVTEVVQNESN